MPRAYTETNRPRDYFCVLPIYTFAYIPQRMDSVPTPYEALLACEKAAGGQTPMARDLGVSQPTIWRWIQSSKRMPAEYVLRAESLYGVSRHHLRPDIYPHDLPPFTPRVAGEDEIGSGNRSGILPPEDEA